ncbi:hypothetical protein AN958_05934 [Leucoagaricus sp. SymC.cos]|nr:hypothetical protein AN958_05934 [Leucoagaricus sp. SymC.cos]
MYILQPNPIDFTDWSSKVAREKFQQNFALAPAPLNSQIGRGRHAIAVLLVAMVRDACSVPQDAPIRKEAPQIFELAEQMDEKISKYLRTIKEGNPPTTNEIVDGIEWGRFWFGIQEGAMMLGHYIGGAGLSGFVDVGEGVTDAMEKVQKEVLRQMG